MRPSILASLPDALGRIALAGAVVGAACVAYGVLIERTWYRRRVYRLPLLPAEVSGPVRVLHLSDLHLRSRERRKLRFLSSLEQPDVAVLTGDLVGEPHAVETVVDALRPLRGRLASYFVLGSNDYFLAQRPNYLVYLFGRTHRRKGVPGRGPDLIRLLEADGWVHLKNRKTELSSDGVRFEVLGLDDPHIYRQDLRVAPRQRPEEFGLALVHSPDPAPELAALGYRLILAGHTHGGQVRLPFVGALITNSYLPRRLCMGLVRLPPAVMHVSPGMGQSRYAPFRFLARPEATVLELVEGPAYPATTEPATADPKTRS
ncbi:MAG TPA: metallophosphoesterase [Actinomycetota bacterium]|nr:metallophosphoesterase [Actinomycetota bacterium]